MIVNTLTWHVVYKFDISFINMCPDLSYFDVFVYEVTYYL